MLILVSRTEKAMMERGQHQTVNFSIIVKSYNIDFCSEMQNSRVKMGVQHAIWRVQDYLYPKLVFPTGSTDAIIPLGQIGLELKRGPLKQKKTFYCRMCLNVGCV